VPQRLDRAHRILLWSAQPVVRVVPIGKSFDLSHWHSHIQIVLVQATQEQESFFD
jgi:hypothetical protein